MNSDKKVKIIPIDSIDTGERFRVDMGDMNELVESIKSEGLITAITVKEKEDGRYQLLAGKRRLDAFRILASKDPEKWSSIPSRIYPSGIGNISMLSIELEENYRRKDFVWDEEVALKKRIHDEQTALYKDEVVYEGEGSDRKGHVKKGWRVADTAKLLDEAQPNTSRDLRLAEALEIMPELKKYKTKDEAAKALKSMKRLHTASANADYIKKKHAEDKPEDVRMLLSDAFIIDDFLKHDFKERKGMYDFISFDPPYAIDIQKNKKAKNPNMLKDVYNEIGEDVYEDIMRSFIQKSYTMLGSKGWIIIWHSPEFMPMFLKLLKEVGFEGRAIPGVWVKDKGQTNRPEMYLASVCEFFLYARKGEARLAREGRGNAFIYKPIPPQRKRHITEKPIELMEDIISTFIPPGTRLLSPCLGSGNDLLAAVNIGVFGEGTELTPEFKDLYISEVYKASPPNYKSYKE